jgi:regulator of sigma E protease
MATLTTVATNFWSSLTFLFAALFVLTVVVFFHELGHFLVARWCGVAVKVFSIGFGREIVGWHDRHGTRWRVAWIPLGGYVKFMDDENAASVPSRDALEKMSEAERAGSFHAKPLWQRAAVVVAGPVANFLLAIVVFTTMYIIFGQRITAATVDEIVPGSPAAKAGFEVGDVIKKIDGETVASFNDVQRIVATRLDRDLSVVVDRKGRAATLTVRPELSEEKDAYGGVTRRTLIGIKRSATPQMIEVNRVGPLAALQLGVADTAFIVKGTFSYIGDVIARRQKADQVGGIIRMAEFSGQAAKVGIDALVQLMAVISVSVGLINLFPIPLLDGGHLLFYAVEAVLGRPLGEKTQEIGFRIGLALVLMLMAFATLNDLPILRKWFSWLG